MKRKLFKKLNIKSEKGFTIQDLVAAIIIFGIFTASIISTMNMAYRLSYKIRVTENAVAYSINILEDIDKLTYEEVNNNSLTEAYYKAKFHIPEAFHIAIEVSNMTSSEEKKDDIIKKVKFTLDYTVYQDTERIIIERYKIREL